jgi:predicted nucleotidyltransferase
MESIQKIIRTLTCSFDFLEDGQRRSSGPDWLCERQVSRLGGMLCPDAKLLLTTDQLPPMLHANQCQWRQRYQLQRLGIFGSTALNEATKNRDVDGWVELDVLAPLGKVLLMQELEAQLLRPVDWLRLRKRMNPALLRQSILRDGYGGVSSDLTLLLICQESLAGVLTAIRVQEGHFTESH